MGLPMAEALLKDNNDVYGYDVRPPDEFHGFADRMLPEIGNLQASDILLLVVRNSNQISEICFGDPGVYQKETYPRLLVVSSTVSPRYILELRQKLPDDVQLVDAPMSGAPVAARNRTLTFMLGGDTDAIQRLQPLVDAMGTHSFVLGETGQGMLAKVLNNYIAASSVVSVRNGLAHAEKLGMSPATLLKVINLSSGGSWFSSKFEDIEWRSEEYDPENTIGILEKDVTAALDVIDHEQPVSDAFGQSLLYSLRHLPAMPNDPDTPADS